MYSTIATLFPDPCVVQLLCLRLAYESQMPSQKQAQSRLKTPNLVNRRIKASLKRRQSHLHLISLLVRYRLLAVIRMQLLR